MTKELDFCTIKFHENYAVCIINEGETITNEKSEIQTEYLLNHYKKRPFVYITNRVNSYSVDPTIYNTTSQIESLAGFAVVSKNDFALNNALIEKLFLKKPFELFYYLNDAKKWANTILTNEGVLK